MVFVCGWVYVFVLLVVFGLFAFLCFGLCYFVIVCVWKLIGIGCASFRFVVWFDCLLVLGVVFCWILFLVLLVGVFEC